MDFLELPVPGLNKHLWFLIFLGFFSCQSKSDEKQAYLDAGKANIITKKGITYIDTTPITGVVFSLNEKGDTVSVIPYLNGKEHGYSRYYYENGRIKSLRYSKNGWKEGEHTGWFDNGQIQFQYHFKNDMFEGNQKEWLSSGQLYSDLNYEKGMESGSQKVWYPNGKIKTNYIIKDNRRYGLLGSKNCINTADSVLSEL